MAITLYTFKDPITVHEVSQDTIEQALLWRLHTKVEIPPGHKRDITPAEYPKNLRLELQTYTKKIFGQDVTVAEKKEFEIISVQSGGPEGGTSAETENEISSVPINGTANESTVTMHIEGSNDQIIFSVIRYTEPKGSSRSGHWTGEDELKV